MIKLIYKCLENVISYNNINNNKLKGMNRVF